MDEKTLLYAGIMLFGVFISSVSQAMLKKASMKEYPSRFREYANPLVIGAYAIFLVSTFCSICAYKVIPLSWGPIIGASGYFFVTAFGVLLFGEKMNRRKGMALGLIVVGILIFSLS